MRYSIAVYLALFFLLMAPYGRITVTIAVSFWALLGTKQALQSLMIAIIARSFSPALADTLDGMTLLGWIHLSIAAARILLDRVSAGWPFGLRHVFWLFIFSIVVFVEALAVSAFPQVSMFKVVSFFVGAAAILYGFDALQRKKIDFEPEIVGLWLAVVFLSVPTVFFPAIGFQRDGVGFQGILSHPQTYAVFLTPAATWLTARILLSKQPLPGIFYVALPAVVVSMLLTRGRTGVVAATGAFLIVGAISIFLRRKWFRHFALRLPKYLAPSALALVLALGLVFADGIYTSMSRFLVKNIDNTTFSESFHISRGFLIDESLLNFYENPWFGIGFGVAKSDLKPFKPVIHEATGLPLGASTEKPNLVIAVLEETGLVGALVFVAFFASLYSRVARSAEIMPALVFFSIVLTNISEMTFFSIGGLGLYCWMLIGFSTHRVVRAT